MKFFAMPSEIVLSVFPYVFPIFFYHRMENMAHSIVTMNSIFVFTLAYQVFREIRKKVCPRQADGKASCSMLARFVISTVLSLGGFGLFGFHIAMVRNRFLALLLFVIRNQKSVLVADFGKLFDS